jgi:putative acetyltransferase
VTLRLERSDDHATVRDLHRRAFGDQGEVADLVNDLRTTIGPYEGLSLVAEEAGEVVGHVMFTRSVLDAPDRLVDVQVLSPLAIRPDHQRRGVGAALVRRGLELMAERNVPVVFLEGSPSTTGASASRPAATTAFASRRCAFPMPPSRSSCSPDTSRG